MFSDPTEARGTRQRFLHHRGAVNKGAIMERTNLVGNPVCQLLEAATHQTMVVSTEGVSGDIGLILLF